MPLPGRSVQFQTFGTVGSVRVTIRRGHSGLRSVLDRAMRLFPTELGHFPPQIAKMSSKMWQFALRGCPAGAPRARRPAGCTAAHLNATPGARAPPPSTLLGRPRPISALQGPCERKNTPQMTELARSDAGNRSGGAELPLERPRKHPRGLCWICPNGRRLTAKRMRAKPACTYMSAPPWCPVPAGAAGAALLFGASPGGAGPG